MTKTAKRINETIDDVAICVENGIDICATYMKIAFVDIPSKALKTTVKIVDFPFDLTVNTFKKMEQQQSESAMMMAKCYNFQH